MSPHTPRPWHVSPQADGRLFICTLGECLAEVFESRENAELIAAAPELLEACEFVEEFFAKMENQTAKDDPLKEIRAKFHAPIHNKLRPLIRKARCGQ